MAAGGRGRRRALAAAVAAVLCACALAATPAVAAPPPVKHVFVIVLENKGFDETFGPGSKAPYLSTQLTAQGELLTNYYGIAHLSLPNYVAMVSGQSPNTVTQSDCQFYTDVAPGVPTSDGQTLGQGCVYPASTKTLADQLDAAGLSWKGYMEDMGNAAPAQPATCRHPALNSRDSTQSARVGDQYAARHNPFVYFHSIIDTPRCDANDVPLDRFPTDLAAAATTPSFSFITPNLCNDGHDPSETSTSSTCVDGRPGGLVTADAFLQQWVPRILGSPAYAEGGLLAIVFDETEASPTGGDASSCCNEQPGPNTPNPGGLVPGSGGGRTGAVVISSFTRPGSVNPTPYNHYALLRSIEDLFGLGHLGFAGQPGLEPFGDDVYNAAAP